MFFIFSIYLICWFVKGFPLLLAVTTLQLKNDSESSQRLNFIIPIVFFTNRNSLIIFYMSISTGVCFNINYISRINEEKTICIISNVQEKNINMSKISTFLLKYIIVLDKTPIKLTKYYKLIVLSSKIHNFYR